MLFKVPGHNSQETRVTNIVVKTDKKEKQKVLRAHGIYGTDGLRTAHTETACCLLLPCSGK